MGESDEDVGFNKPDKGGFIAKNIPDHLKDKQGKAAPLALLVATGEALREKLNLLEVKGRENLPKEGAYLMISNHFGGGAGNLFALEPKLRLMAGERLNWKVSGFREQILKGLGAIPILESFELLPENERQSLLDRVPGEEDKERYRSVMQKTNFSELRQVANQLNSAVAVLASGDPVGILPEGLKNFDEMRGDYRKMTDSLLQGDKNMGDEPTKLEDVQ